MQLQLAVNRVFVQLASTLQQLSHEQYVQPCASLYGNTIGQHVRHVIELFQCLENGYDLGLVNYEKRKRDRLIETCQETADHLLRQIQAALGKADKVLTLEACYDDFSDEQLLISTNYYREVAYNLEHTIHHMALIRCGIDEVSDIALPENFGVATSTIKHRDPCAQ